MGIVLHRLLERWDGASPDALHRALAPLCDETAREMRTDRAELEREAGEILRAFLSGGLAERFARVERIGAEVPLLVHDERADCAYRGSVDLLYRDANGELVVADFKTDRTAERDELRASYGSQLAVYADAVQQALGLPQRPRTELWLLRSGEIVPLDGPPPDPPGGDRGPSQLSLW